MSTLKLSETVLATADNNSREDLVSYARKAVRSLDPANPETVRTPGIQVALSILKQVFGEQGHGVIWKGFPPWLNKELFAELDSESISRRAKASKLPPPGEHYWVSAGNVGRDMANSAIVKTFLESHIGDLIGEARSNYNYYEKHGHAAYPHVDEPEFGINMIIMLEHTFKQPPRSSLILYPVGDEPIEVRLVPGEAVLFHARSTVHQRVPVACDEAVRIVSIGYSNSYRD